MGDDSTLFIIFFDHSLDNGINLSLFFQVLLVGLLTQQICIIDLLLNFPLVALKRLKFLLVLLALDLVADFLVLKHSHVDGCILLL